MFIEKGLSRGAPVHPTAVVAVPRTFFLRALRWDGIRRGERGKDHGRVEYN